MASDNCSESYELTRGPEGSTGPLGAQGPRPARAADGPQGLPGLPGKSKIDISTETETAPYKTFNGFKSPAELELASLNNVGFNIIISTFIFPGEENWGGLLERVSILAALENISGTFFTGRQKGLEFEVYYLEKDSNNRTVETIIGTGAFNPVDDSEMFTNDKKDPQIFPIELAMDNDPGQQLIFVRLKSTSLRGYDCFIYSLEAY